MGPEFIFTEGTKAGLLVAIGAALHRVALLFLKRADQKQRSALADIDKSFETGSKIRNELRQLADDYHRRAVSAEQEADRVNALLIECGRTIEGEKRARQAAQDEVRYLKRKLGLRTIPPDVPPPPPEEPGPEDGK